MTEFLDFDDIEVKSKFKEKYKGIIGEKHRIALIWPRPVEGKNPLPFVKAKAHYTDKYFLCKDGICCEKLGPPKDRIGCLIIHYKANPKDGVVVRREDAKEFYCDYVIKPWIFSNTKFEKLKTLHQEWDLKSRDMLVTCEGQEQFQDLTFTPCKEAIWQMTPAYKERIYRESELDNADMIRSLGQDLSIEEIKELLGLEITQPADNILNQTDLNAILAEV